MLIQISATLAVVAMLFLALLFFALLPGIGAFIVRRQWRVFRETLVKSSLRPLIQYRSLQEIAPNQSAEFRFFGTIESLDQGDRVWLRGGNVSISAVLKNVRIYTLPTRAPDVEAVETIIERNKESIYDEAPGRIAWSRIFSLPEGTQVYISGRLFKEGGTGLFRSVPGEPLIVILFDGPGATIIRRAIWGGRQRNEYWNPFTPASVAAGTFSLLILSYLLFRSPYLQSFGIMSLVLGFLPILVFLPPGFVLVYFYRSFWRRARFYRAERDLLRLPLRFFNEAEMEACERSGAVLAVRLPDGEPYGMTVRAGRRDFHFSDGLRPPVRKPLFLIGKPVSRSYFGFGKILKEGTDDLGKSSDAMAESIIIPGNPLELSSLCQKNARLLEVLSIVLLVAGIAVNLALAVPLFTAILG